ncbi:MAG TPA: hypothetical protein VFN37_02535 [Candidatus Baltobacteraceae bacterium]|nr:hypothetical protein [Candidatus Baltobacteraceae bacterium]
MIHLLLAALTATPSCWDIYDKALTHSAASAHPPYITYDERISITDDDESLLRSAAHIDYRDDGMARVADERFDYAPILTREVEPGPPELGPYGPGRSMWLAPPPGVPTIAVLRARGMVRCANEGMERLKSREVYHLAFRGANPARAHLDDLWIDAHSYDIWRLRVTGPVALLASANSSIGLGKYDVEMAYQGPYLVVDHVVWSYRERIYSQYADYTGEYTFSDFAFPRELPPSFFASVAQPLEQPQ